MNQGIRITAVVLLTFSMIAVSGCKRVYYGFWEKLGKEKRHLLKDSVEGARDEQEEASEEFKDVLTRMKELYGFEGGDLEKLYGRLKDDSVGQQEKK